MIQHDIVKIALTLKKENTDANPSSINYYLVNQEAYQSHYLFIKWALYVPERAFGRVVK